MTRDEHMEWCKKRALEYIDNGDIRNAWASMSSDLQKHPETKNHAAIGLGTMMLLAGDLGTIDKMRRFIEGFS